MVWGSVKRIGYLGCVFVVTFWFLYVLELGDWRDMEILGL